MAFTQIELARAVQADRERRYVPLPSLRPALPGTLPAQRRRRRDDKPRLRWPWRLPQPVFPVGYGR